MPAPLFYRLLRQAPAAKVLGLLVLMVLASLSEGVGIVLLVPLLDLLQSGKSASNPLVAGLWTVMTGLGLSRSAGGLLVAFVLLVCLRAIVQYAREVLGSSIQHQLVDQLRYRCFTALLGAEWRWVAAGRMSDHANLLLQDVSRVGVGLNFGMSLLATLATMAAYLLAAFSLSWQMTMLALISGGLILGLLSGQRRQALRMGHSMGAANRSMQGNVQESLAGIKLAKILGNESRHLALFLEVIGRLRQQQLHFMATTSRSRALFQAGGAALLAGYLFLGLTVWQAPVPELLTLILVFGRLIPLFASAQQQYYQWLHALPALLETDRLLAQCEQAAEPSAASIQALGPVQTSICLEHVTVQYADRTKPALDDISICFPARTTTAIMGASGAGKSTLADVLMGLLVADKGRLQIDGEPVQGIERLRWRRSVAYVPQETFLFNDTIRNNLLWGNLQASDLDLRLALQRAAADFVFSLPQGLDTPVGDGGIRLSGGERQRLALARALLKKPSLLILDEATSALDKDNERRIRQAVESLHGDLTVVIIGHRLATLHHADQVLVLNEGRVKVLGSWEQVQGDLGEAQHA